MAFIAVFGAWYVLGNREIFGTDMLLSGFSSVVIISVIAFFSVRARHVYAGMLLSYIAQWGAVCIYLFTMMLSFPSPAQDSVIKVDMSLIIGAAAVWTGIVFIWRMCRHKV